MTSRPIFWIGVGAIGYWALQHFTGIGTSGMGAHASAGGGKAPAA